MEINRKVKTLTELYNATQLIAHPEMTPVLRGEFRMRGPVDDLNCDDQTDTISSLGGRHFIQLSQLEKPHMMPESGICNVCSAPCSSCMHVSRSLMGSKSDESSRGASRENSGGQFSINKSDILPPVSGDRDDIQHAVSESSNIHSATSSHDPFPANVGRKIKLKSSVASEDVEMDTALSSGGTAEPDQFSSRSCQVSDSMEHSDKLDSRGHTEGHDDSISCAGGEKANCANTGTSDRHIEENRTLSLEVVSNIASEGSEKGIHVHTTNLGSSINVEESDNTHRRGIERDIAPGQKSPSPSSEVSLQAEPLNQGEMIEKVTENVLEGNCDSAMTFVSEAEVGGEKGRELPDKALEYLRQTGEDETLAEPIEFQEPPSQSPSEEESDGSDVVEHDVKVCDICGDAGREDLLATCSRCIDGAEHIYCMRVRLDKVPEGEWFCEECKLAEEAEQKKLDKGSKVFENEKNQSSGQVSSGDTDVSVKLDSNDLDVSAKRRRQVSLGTELSWKRELDMIQIGRDVRRKVAETNKDSPKSTSPTRTSLSRESSFKKTDKDKMKSVVTSPPGTPRFQAPKGALVKSNSFSAMNIKPRVKPVDDIPPKQKRIRELGSMDTKDGPPRMLSKSMSLKPSLGRTSTTEAKVKMLSPRSSHVQDMKPLKPIKERSTFDRKNSLKADRPGVASVTAGSSLTAPKFDQKLSSRDNISLSSGSNIRELKTSRSDDKYAFPRSFGHPVRKGSDILGESKWSTAASTTSSTNDVRNPAEQKPVQLSPKDESGTNSSWSAEKSSNTSNRILQDNSRPPTDVSTGRSLKEEMSKGNELKAAIQAAMLKKPGICKKNRLSDTEPSDELSVTSTDLGNGVAVLEQLSVSNLVRNTVSADSKYAVHSSTSDSCKENNVNSARRITTSSGEVFSYNDDNRFTADRKFNLRDFSVHPMSALLKMSAIPEHEYVWQGDFEVSRSGKVLEVCYGVQAHMSSLASPKVSEVVKKFLPRVPLTEVPRLSTWPAQFHTHGATEDNIALYFFARDLESYERNYKSLVETLMKGDLALKGNVDGVELLIFPSNQLPENSQRWNMLFFLWAVFRTRKVSCQDLGSGSSREVDLPRSLIKTQDKNIPTAALPSSEDRCLHRSTDNESSDCNRLRHVIPEYNSLESSTPSMVSASKTTNGDSDGRKSSTDKTCSVTQAKSKLLDSTLDSHTLPRNSMDSAVSYQKQDSVDSSVKKQNGVPGSKSYVKHEVPALACSTKDTVQKLPMDQDPSNAGQRLSIAGSVKTEKIQDIAYGNITSVKKEGNLKQEDGLDLKTSSDVDSLIQDMPVKQSADCLSIIRKRPHLDLMEPPFEAPSSSTSETMPWNCVNSLSVGGENISKKPKTDPCASQISRSISIKNPDSQMHDRYTTFSAEEKPDLNCNIVDSQISRGVAVNDPESQMHDVSFCAAEKPDLNRDIVEISEAADAERFFFPVVSCPVKDLTSTPWRPVSSDAIHDQPNGWFHKDILNLELALGAEAKSREQVILLGKRIVDDRMNQEKLPDVAGTTNIKEEDISATLSLSLSFPFSDKEKATVKPPSKTEPLLQERRGASGSLLLFGGFTDKALNRIILRN